MKKTLPGSNQYVVRYQLSRKERVAKKRSIFVPATKRNTYGITLLTFYGVVVCCIILVRMLFLVQSSQKANAQFLNPSVPEKQAMKTKITVVSQKPTPAPDDPNSCENRIKLREKIKQYIYTIFQNDAATAYAVSLAESGTGGVCPGEVVYKTNALHHSDYEHSVGIFQINLFNKWTNIHASQVPGETMNDKEKWLDDPYNNAVFAAYLVSNDGGWNAWSTYTEGQYLSFLNN